MEQEAWEVAEGEAVRPRIAQAGRAQATEEENQIKCPQLATELLEVSDNGDIGAEEEEYLEEETRTTAEFAQPVSTELDQTDAPIGMANELDVKPTGVAPDKRGGGPRGDRGICEELQTQATRVRRSEPEVVCWKRERVWILNTGVHVASRWQCS